MGEVCTRCVDAITDSQSTGTREEKKINVLSFVVLDKRFRQVTIHPKYSRRTYCVCVYSFYDHYGRPDLTKIEALLGSQYKASTAD